MDYPLYIKLNQLRDQIKKENNKKRRKDKTISHHIVSDESLESICSLIPRTIEEFKVIRGIGDAFIENYASRFLMVIHEHLINEKSQMSASQKELEILNKLSNKLVNINQKNRLLYNGRLSNKYGYDLLRMDEKKAQKLVDAFLNEDGNKSQVVTKVAYDKGKLTKARDDFNALKSLYRQVQVYKVEKGQEVLYVGYPFVEGRFLYDDFKVKAPLLLFPAKLDVVNNEYRVSFDQSRDIVYNTTLILAANKFNNKNEVIPDGVVENISKEHFIDDAITFFKSYNIEIQANEVELEAFKDTTNSNFPLYQDEVFRLKGYCVLGAFPTFSNSIQKDYNEIVSKQNISQLVRNLFTGIDDISDTGIKYHQEIFAPSDIKDADEVDLMYINALNYSQEKVLNQIDKKDALVIQGPPGTGKSQTITSLVSQAVLQNKRVLIVSEKKTALDVIYNRLDKVANFVLYIDDPNNKEIFYERLLALLEFDDELLLRDQEIKERAFEINYELGKLNELEILLDQQTSLTATLRELYQNSNRLNVKDKEVNRLFKEINIRKKRPYSLAELLKYRQLFLDHSFVKSLIDYKHDSKYEEVYQLFKEDLKETDLQIPNRELLEISFYINLYNKFGWFIKSLLNHKNKEITQRIKAVSAKISGKLKKKMRKLIFRDADLFINAITVYPQYIHNQKLYNSMNDGEKSYFEYCYSLSNKLKCKFSFVNQLMIDIYTTSVIEEFEVSHANILINTERYTDIREKISELSNIKQKMTFDALYNYLQIQISDTFNKHSKRLQELRRKCESKRRWSIHKLLNEFKIEIYNSIYVWLLTPDGVSEILPLEENFFDLIIFDEASQMFIENSIPILFRGKKAIVAGDSKQLRPSKFAVGRIDSDDLEYDAYTGVLEEESLLDLAKHRYHEVMLNYHYRSKYEELIAFSNYAFYDGKLHVCPNASLDDDKPIERIKVNGRWIDRKNEVEADEIIILLRHLFKTKQDKTIGIITFNSTQKDLILDKIEQECLINTEFNQVIVNERLKPSKDQLFVKNIENVQGDERDIIIFSIGYAPNEQNRIVRQFGWLNNEGGENRLNVAISRAKEKVYVVTSIEPFELQVRDMKNNGPKLLRSYLEYVKAISEKDRETAQKILLGLSNEIEQSNELAQTTKIKDDLYQELTNIGLLVEKDVGIGSHKIDLAIKDQITNAYILGIELDYKVNRIFHSTKEKDYHRQKYLEFFGWNVHRTWCSDYWRNKQKEIDKIINLVNRYMVAS